MADIVSIADKQPDSWITSPEMPMSMWHLIPGCALVTLSKLPSSAIDATITSPPYFRQKDYGVKDQMGWESSLDQYLAKLRIIFSELLRVTASTGTCFFVIGDSFARRSMQLVPQRAAIIAVETGWTLRNDLIWAKTDAAPGCSSGNRWRFTHEHVLFMSKSSNEYKFDAASIRVPYNERTIRRWGNGQTYGGRKAGAEAGAQTQRFARGKSFRLNPEGTLPSDVLVHSTARSKHDHYATFPLGLIERFVLATTDPGDVVLDPFMGTGTTGVGALKHGRKFLGIELSPTYLTIARERLAACSNGESDGGGSKRDKEDHRINRRPNNTE
jgi:site-specific DNA-methyltransferase (adenine-specific)